MKRLLLLFVFFALGRIAFGQELDFKVKVDSTGTGEYKRYSVSINVTKGEPLYSYVIYYGLPSKNKIFKTEENLSSKTIVIEGLTGNQNYSVCLYPGKDIDSAIIKTVKLH
jgi:hypothetical protein